MSQASHAIDTTTSLRWAHRLAVAAFACAVPLVLFGGSVTTLGAGMAVEGWLIAEGHFLLFFPIEEWLRDTETFVEHTHRLFGVLVGLAAIAACACAWRSARRSAAWTATAALAAVCAQGALGGFRVLENSPNLAFLHGVAAQAVFCLLGVSALVTSARWRTTPTRREQGGGALRFLAVAASLVVFGQVVLGAVYRHALRPQPEAGNELWLALHFAGAGLAFFAVLALAGALRSAAERGGENVLRPAALRLHLLLGLQILLGMMAWVGFRPGAIGPAEWVLSIAHVLGGALLLTQTVAIALWSFRLFQARPLAAPRAGLPSPEGAR